MLFLKELWSNNELQDVFIDTEIVMVFFVYEKSVAFQIAVVDAGWIRTTIEQLVTVMHWGGRKTLVTSGGKQVKSTQ